MKVIQNKTTRPLRVPLPGGKTLHLGPAQTAQISEKATEHAGLQKFVADGSIEILGEGERPTSMHGGGDGREQTHGVTKSLRHSRGDR